MEVASALRTYWFILVILFISSTEFVIMFAQPPQVAGIGGRVTVDGVPVEDGYIVHVRNNVTGEEKNATTENGWYAASMNAKEGDEIYVWMEYNGKIYSNTTFVDLGLPTQFCNISISNEVTVSAGGTYYGNEGEKIYVTGNANVEVDDWVWECNGVVKHGRSVYFILNDGIYTATLTIHYGGKTASDTATINVRNLPPVASAGDMYFATAGKTVTLDASGSHDYDELMFKWDFNGDRIWDTDYMNSSRINHTYMHEGIYTVYVNVSDGKAYDVDSAMVVVSMAVKPSADFIYTVNGSMAYFNATGDANNYTWNFGDGNTGYGKSVSHEYSIGKYNVTLTVILGGETNSSTRMIEIMKGNMKPVACMKINGSMADGDAVHFISCSYDPDGYITNWTWNIDGRKFYTENVSIVMSAGNYTAYLTVKDNNGSFNSTSLNFTIKSDIVTIRISVAGSDGKVLNNAKVELGNLTSYTDGGVAVFHVKKGNYTIRIVKNGYRGKVLKIKVDKSRDVGVIMEKKSIPGFEFVAVVVAVVVVMMRRRR